MVARAAQGKGTRGAHMEALRDEVPRVTGGTVAREALGCSGGVVCEEPMRSGCCLIITLGQTFRTDQAVKGVHNQG